MVFTNVVEVSQLAEPYSSDLTVPAFSDKKFLPTFRRDAPVIIRAKRKPPMLPHTTFALMITGESGRNVGKIFLSEKVGTMRSLEHGIHCLPLKALHYLLLIVCGGHLTFCVLFHDMSFV